MSTDLLDEFKVILNDLIRNENLDSYAILTSPSEVKILNSDSEIEKVDEVYTNPVAEIGETVYDSTIETNNYLPPLEDLLENDINSKSSQIKKTEISQEKEDSDKDLTSTHISSEDTNKSLLNRRNTIALIILLVLLLIAGILFINNRPTKEQNVPVPTPTTTKEELEKQRLTKCGVIGFENQNTPEAAIMTALNAFFHKNINRYRDLLAPDNPNISNKTVRNAYLDHLGKGMKKIDVENNYCINNIKKIAANKYEVNLNYLNNKNSTQTYTVNKYNDKYLIKSIT